MSALDNWPMEGSRSQAANYYSDLKTLRRPETKLHPMALDVHVVDNSNRKQLTDRPSCQFEEHVHNYIFNGCNIDIYNRYAYLRRMIDYYSDTQYSGEALDAVVVEIDDLLPHLTTLKEAVETLTQFRSICVDARAAGKSVFLICD